MARGASGRRAHLPQPVFEVVVVRHARDAAAGDVEKRADPQAVVLTHGGRQPRLALQIGAEDEELGRRARARGIGHDFQFHDLLAVAAVHALEEGAEGGLASLGAALVDVVDDVLGKQVQHRRAVAGVEGGIVFADELKRGFLWVGHGAHVRKRGGCVNGGR